MKTQKPNQSGELDLACDQLMDEGYNTTELFQPWKEDFEPWKQLNIKPGIGQLLAKNVSKWNRERGGPTLGRGVGSTPKARPPYYTGVVMKSVEEDTPDGGYDNDEIYRRGYSGSDLDEAFNKTQES